MEAETTSEANLVLWWPSHSCLMSPAQGGGGGLSMALSATMPWEGEEEEERRS